VDEEEGTGRMLQEPNKTQLKYCDIFTDSWEANVLLELRANFKEALVSVTLSKLSASYTIDSLGRNSLLDSTLISKPRMCPA
jgi:hypothetical protein